MSQDIFLKEFYFDVDILQNDWGHLCQESFHERVSFDRFYGLHILIDIGLAGNQEDSIELLIIKVFYNCPTQEQLNLSIYISSGFTFLTPFLLMWDRPSAHLSQSSIDCHAKIGSLLCGSCDVGIY